ncbi:MAG: phosphoglycerate mutase (2,3-diphosphoglycerate-independent) [Planctomycetes bacterium GWF2_50_10]|nr:MAG: phosphoglycerate mutase (2,3-diphosphoglycerate-independent) [Planctomycetes bacterium GWF2_50_10]
MSKAKLSRRPFALIIRDGWGYNPDTSMDKFNAIKLAKTPTDDMLMGEYPNTLIHTSGEAVGLAEGTMGNSEVGHQNIGAGRIVYQESVRLTLAIREGTYYTNAEFIKAVDFARKHNGKLHLWGLCSDIGVHSLLPHLYGLLEMAKRQNFKEVYLHAFTDGRDSPPQSGAAYLQDIQNKMDEIGVGKIASVSGRFYAMDRDQRWDRVQRAYDCLRFGKGGKAQNAVALMKDSYTKDITDEFIEPTNIVDAGGKPLATVENGDSVIFFNFRGDRTREITRAFVDPDFKGFDRGAKPDLYYVCLTEYDATIPAPVAFPKPAKMKNIAAQYFGELGITQFRCAETEKYAHVTFFFNDYTEAPFPGEERQIVPSPKVRTYDLKPEMSAYEVASIVLEKLDTNKYDLIIVNFANPDMVGHTGIPDAAIRAAQVVDECVGKILAKIKSMGGAALVTADHGNFEQMYDPSTSGPHTAHTVGDVPLIVFDEKNKGRKLRSGGCLADVMPTLLDMMELPKPAEMTGRSLLG